MRKPSDPLGEIEQLSTTSRDVNPFWEYRHDRFRLPNGQEGTYYYVHSRGSALVLPITERGTILLVRQVRYLNRRVSLELPGGGVKPGATAAATAVEELAEEARVQAQTLERIGVFNPCNGMTDELCEVFVATQLRPAFRPRDQGELMEIVEMSQDAVNNAIADGLLWDGMTLAAWSLYRIWAARQGDP